VKTWKKKFLRGSGQLPEQEEEEEKKSTSWTKREKKSIEQNKRRVQK